MNGSPQRIKKTTKEYISNKFKAFCSSVIPTEPFFVIIFILLPLVNMPWTEKKICYALIFYAEMSIFIYFSMRSFLRRNGFLESLWKNQVINPQKCRVSVGTIVSFAEHFHILQAFLGIFLFLVNIIYSIEGNIAWKNALYIGIMGFNLKGFDDIAVPHKMETRLLCMGLSILNTLFLGFFAAVFLKPFIVVFKHK